MNSQRLNPIKNISLDIKKILDSLEIKNNKEALLKETENSLELSELWMIAKLKEDNYISYYHWWQPYMFQEIVNNTKMIDIQKWKQNPYSLPLIYQERMLALGREYFLYKYEEENEYYRRLQGLPPIDDKNPIYMSKELMNKLKAPNKPVHELSLYFQNKYINTKEYFNVLKDNPDKLYLKYLGKNKVDLFTARKAKDFEIIKFPQNILNVNKTLLNSFVKVYNECREYVMVVLYNKHFEDLYKGYREFMGMLIMSYTIMRLMNKSLENMKEFIFFDDSVLYHIMKLYNVPTDVQMTKNIRHKLVKAIPKLIQHKASDDIYFDLINTLEYDEVDISKLMIIRNYSDIEDKNDDNIQFPSDKFIPYHKIFNMNFMDIEYDELDFIQYGEPYFVKIPLRSKNPNECIVNNKCKKYKYGLITENDPYWINDNIVKNKILDTNYSITDSKYITLDIKIHQNKYMIESILFPRMIFDNFDITDKIDINISPYLNSKVTLFDLMLGLIAINFENIFKKKNNGLKDVSIKVPDPFKYKGDLDIYDEVDEYFELYALYGFNFDINLSEMIEYVENTSLIDKAKIINFLNTLYINNLEDIYRVFNSIVSMREWFEKRIYYSTKRKDYNEYINIYRALYSYDYTKNIFKNKIKKYNSIEIIKSYEDEIRESYNVLENFYPHTENKKVITIEELEGNKHNTNYSYPFLSEDNEIPICINIKIKTQYGEEDRGNLYFYDVLTCDNCLELTNPDGTRIFMDYQDSETGWQINKQALEEAFKLLSELKEMENVYFQIDTFIKENNRLYKSGEQLEEDVKSIYKYILIEKLSKDVKIFYNKISYKDLLLIKNKPLHDLLFKIETGGRRGVRFINNKNSYELMIENLIKKIESALDLHLRYFEKFILGDDLFYKPLTEMINRFKSKYVDISSIDFQYIFDDKIDSGGSNSLKLFDELKLKFHINNFTERGDRSELSLYDTEHKINYHIEMNDKSEMIKMVQGEGFLAQERTESIGSIRMSDEAMFFKNGKPVDPDGQHATWVSGEPGLGRWDNETNYIMKVRKGSKRITKNNYDMDGWKDFIPSMP